jgi:hypothetical protein
LGIKVNETREVAILHVFKDAPCLYFVAGRKWFGLARRFEFRHPVFSPECVVPEPIARVQERINKGGKGAIFEVAYEGALSEPGRYGRYKHQVILHRIRVLRSPED